VQKGRRRSKLFKGGEEFWGKARPDLEVPTTLKEKRYIAENAVL
jgi:hypothetical protein